MIDSLLDSVLKKGEEMASRKDSKGRVLQKGEAQRKDGRYHFAYTNIAGKRCYIYAENLVELRKKERDLHIASWQGANQYGTMVSLNFMFDRSLKLKVGIKASTYASYRQSYDNHVREEFGRQPVKNISYSDILAFYSYLYRSKGLSATTIEHIHLQIYSALKLALQDGMILKNPADGAFGDFKSAAGDEGRKIRALTMDEQKTFLEYIDGHPVWGRYHSIFQVMLGTGLRVGELCGLRWQDVDIEKRLIDVNHGVVCIKAVKGESKERLAVSLPKSKAGIRQVPLMKPVIEAFMEEYRWAQTKHFVSETIDGYTDFIFTKQNGNVYTSHRLDAALYDIVKSYKRQEEALAELEEREPFLLPHISNHMLRHTFCTRLCERDVNIKVIQTVMGHASVNITMDIYAEVSKAKQFEEIDRLADELDVF